MVDGETYDFATGDEVNLLYSFSISDTQARDIMADLSRIYAVDIPIPIPSGTANLDKKLDIQIVDIDTGLPLPLMQYGTLTVDSFGNTACIIFEGDFWSSPYASLGIKAADFAINYTLDKDAFTDDGPYTITLSDGTIIYLDIDAPKTPPDTVKENGVYDENTGFISWTVTYNPGDMMTSGGTVTFPYNITFKDTFETAVHTYVADSFAVNGLQATPEYTPGGDPTLKYTAYEVQNEDPVVFTYQTQLTAAEYAKSGDIFTTNSVTIELPPNSIQLDAVGDIGTLEVPAAGKKMLRKTQDQSVHVDDRHIAWEIEVLTKNLNIEEDTLVVTDTLPEGLQLVTDSIEVYDASGIKLEKDVDYEVIDTAGAGSSFTGSRNFSVKIVSTDYDENYIINFITKVDEKYFKNADTASFENTATLDYEADGAGTNPDNVGSAPGPVGKNTDIIEKVGSPSGSAPNFTITWEVTVNPHHVNVTEATITDTIPAGLEFVENSLECEGSKVPYTVATSGTTTTLLFDVGNIGTNTKIYTFDTKVTETALSKNGGTGTSVGNISFYNTAQFKGTVDNGGEFIRDAGYTVYVPSSVVRKQTALTTNSSTYYNYSTKIVPWRIYVNENKIKMTDAVLTDTLPAYLMYAGNLKITENNANGAVVPDSAYDVDYPSTSNNNTLTITFPSYFSAGNKTAYVTFDTVVDLNNYPNIGTVSSITLSNPASLMWNGVTTTDAQRTSTATQAVPVKMIGKKGSDYDDLNNKVHYTISVNPHDLNLTTCTLTDTLDPALELDLGSVKLYYAEISEYRAGSTTQFNNDGTLVNTGREVPLGSPTGWDWSYSGKKFEVTLPKNSANCYILEYDCYVVKFTSTVSNSVIFNGAGYAQRTASIPAHPVRVDANAISEFTKNSIKLVISKIDSRHPEIPLPDIEFSLYTMIGSTKEKVAGGTTDRQGVLSFTVLSPGKEYWLVEEGSGTQIASYYSTDTGMVVLANGVTKDKKVTGDENDTYSFTAGADGAAQTSVVVTNNPVTTNNIEFYKKCADIGKFLPGAQFRIVTAAPPLQKNPYIVTPFGYTAVSDINGKVNFTDIPVGTTYILKEIKAPEGHTVEDPDKEYIIEVEPNGDYTILEMDGTELFDSTKSQPPLEILNKHEPPQPVTADVEFVKVNKYDTALLLNGATFTLTEIDDANPYTAESTSVNNGAVVFKDVPAGIYTLKEIDAPPYYEPDNAEYTLIINDSGIYRILDSKGRQLYYSDDINAYPDPWMAKNVYGPTQTDAETFADIEFDKVRSGYPEIPVDGAVFVLTEDVTGYPASDGKAPIPPVTAYSKNGKVKFDNVPVGIYTLVETQAPANYELDPTPHTVVVNHDGSYAIDGSFILFSPAGQTTHNDDKEPERWKAENDYRGTSSPPAPSSSSSKRNTWTPESPPISPTIPHPHDPGNTLEPSDDGRKNVYIELDEDGTPVGEWRQERNEDGYLVWVYEEYPPESDIEDEKVEDSKDAKKDHPNTGDSSMLFLWILCFYTAAAVLIALIWTNRKKKWR